MLVTRLGCIAAITSSSRWPPPPGEQDQVHALEAFDGIEHPRQALAQDGIDRAPMGGNVDLLAADHHGVGVFPQGFIDAAHDDRVIAQRLVDAVADRESTFQHALGIGATALDQRLLAM